MNFRGTQSNPSHTTLWLSQIHALLTYKIYSPHPNIFEVLTDFSINLKSKISSVMVNFVCEVDWAIKYRDSGQTSLWVYL